MNVRLGVNDYEHVELEGDAIGTQFTNDARELRVEVLHRASASGAGRSAFSSATASSRRSAKKRSSRPSTRRRSDCSSWSNGMSRRGSCRPARASTGWSTRRRTDWSHSMGARRACRSGACGRSATAMPSWPRWRRRIGYPSPRSSIPRGRTWQPTSCKSATRL